jgi:hypothetical protein
VTEISADTLVGLDIAVGLIFGGLHIWVKRISCHFYEISSAVLELLQCTDTAQVKVKVKLSP